MKRIVPALFAILLTLLPSVTRAVQPDEVMEEPVEAGEEPPAVV